LDLAKNQKINYSEFLTATINVDQYLTEERRNALFSSIDIDQTGKITIDNIKNAFTKFGIEVSDDEI